MTVASQIAVRKIDIQKRRRPTKQATTRKKTNDITNKHELRNRTINEI